MPKTKLGKWAGVLLLIFIVLFIVLILGRNVARWLPGTPLIRTVGMCALLAGIATFVTGLVSLVKFKDRSFVVLSAVIIGSIAILIIIMEVVEGIVWRLTH